jgi:hypothetical protein
VKVRILKQPYGTIHGVSLNHYKVGSIYDMPPTLSEYLVLERFARVEMRQNEKQWHPNDRRRKPPTE